MLGRALAFLSLLLQGSALSGGEAFDEFFSRLLKINSPGGLDKILSLITPNATATITSGPSSETTNLRAYYEGYRYALGSLTTMDSSVVVLQVSGSTVTTEWSSFAIFNSGCHSTLKGFGSYEFNEQGHVTFMQSHYVGLSGFNACAAGVTPPSASVMPSPGMPKGYDEFNRALNHITEKGGMDRLVDLIDPDGIAHVTMGNTTQVMNLRAMIEGSGLDVLSVWVTYWQPLLKTEHGVTASFTNFGIYPNGCVWTFGGYMYVTFNDEGKCTYMWQHNHDVGDFAKCLGEQQLAEAKPAGSCDVRAPEAKPAGSASPVALMALGGAIGVLLSSAAVLTLLGAGWRLPGKARAVPLLQEPSD